MSAQFYITIVQNANGANSLFPLSADGCYCNPICFTALWKIHQTPALINILFNRPPSRPSRSVQYQLPGLVTMASVVRFSATITDSPPCSSSDSEEPRSIIGHFPVLSLSASRGFRGTGFDFRALPDFLSSSVSGMGSTQPRHDNCGATWMKK
jgi:hypothetical protein